MTNLTPFTSIIQVESTRTNAAVSESLVQEMGANINFQNTVPYIESKVDLLIPVDVFAASGTVVNYAVGLFFFDAPAFIFNAGMFVNNNDGSSGKTTCFDMTYYAAPGSAVGSIFSVLPSIRGDAGNNIYTYVGQVSVPSNVVAPVFTGGASTTMVGVSAGAAIVVEVNAAFFHSAATGAGAFIHYRCTN